MAKKQHGGKRPGAGRKVSHPEGPAVVVTASVPSGLVERMDAVAETKGWSRSATVTESVRLLLNRHERKAGESNPAG
jgi:metal-responsive CopG/Arc/MetJ family transcriptional regulator